MKYKLLLLFLTLNITLFSQKIQSPQEFLGYKLGERFTPHYKVVDYFTYVSENLSNVITEEYGKTNELRPLYVAYVSSLKNINDLEQIRQNNLSQAGILNNSKKNNSTAIVWLSYNVHGNEASSTEAAMQTLYELVTDKKEYLENTLVIIDPAVNPDGRDRYVNWFNQVSSSPYNTNQEAKEHRDPWPTGRPNHYLFDLNRDWAWATQVETQQRLKVYNKWLPHIHVDFHEQYINNPYYFAPAAEPFHEIISDWQRDFQVQIGKNHAKHFDRNNWLYFTKESFDLLYPSYGDTYPTFMGAIGMTYEQAGHGMAGLGIDTDHGYELTLVDRIKHHKTTGLSTVEIASKNATKLNSEFKKFFNNKNLTYKSYVLKNTNADKINRLTDLLDKHEIAYNYAKSGKVSGFDYTTSKKGSLQTTSKDLVIHTDQPKGKMVKALFEPNTKLSDSLTYDITAWALPYAHGFKAIASKKKIPSVKEAKASKIKNLPSPSAYAYISKWNSLDDATFLGELLKSNIRVRFSEKPFTINGKSYKRGSIIILRHDNKSLQIFDNKLISIANKNNRKITPVNTGFVGSGVDFGSYSIKPINKQKVAVLSGKGTSSLNFGEIWHFFEQQLKYPLTILDTERFNQINLSNYDVIIIPNGYYGSILNKKDLDNLKKWIGNGGTTIVIGNALKSFAGKKQFELKTKKADTTKVKKAKANLTPYADIERQNTNNLITGAVFKSKVDATHPLAFGYDDAYFSLKLGNTSYEYLKKGGNVVYFTENATNISGFAGKKALKKIPESLLFGEEQIGKGSIIYMVDNPLFRSFWENGKLFFANAVFFRNSSVIKK